MTTEKIKLFRFVPYYPRSPYTIILLPVVIHHKPFNVYYCSILLIYLSMPRLDVFNNRFPWPHTTKNVKKTRRNYSVKHSNYLSYEKLSDSNSFISGATPIHHSRNADHGNGRSKGPQLPIKLNRV